MGPDPPKPDYDYVAYIDEAGCLGLKRLRPKDRWGSSEWFVLGAVVVSRAHEEDVKTWVDDMLEAVRGKQPPGRRQCLHFRNLNDAHKALVCAQLALKPVRCFAVASHKKSLLTWKASEALIKMDNRDWYYNFVSRYILERITYFVDQNSKKAHGETKRVKVVFSERNGLNTGQMGVYLHRLRDQTKRDTHVLKRGNLKWDTFDFSLLRRANHNVSAGAQLADIVASSIFRGCDQHNTNDCDPKFAFMLDTVMAREPDKKSGRCAGFGLKIMPDYRPHEWLPVQDQVFTHFGYPDEWWAPVPSNPSRS
jgi:hypothetical protein